MRILALDAGTSSVKALIAVKKSPTTGGWSVESSSTAPLAPPTSDNDGIKGAAEQDAETWWSAAVAAASGLGDLDSVTAIALSGQMQSTLLLAANGAPLSPALLYCDARATSEAAELVDMLGEDRLRQETANWKGAVSILPKLLWLRRHKPEAISAAATIALSAHDFLFMRLAGTTTPVTDRTNASTTGLLEATTDEWAEMLLRDAGLPAHLIAKLPRVSSGAAALGELSAAAAAALGVRPGVAVHHGSGDLGTATVGALLSQTSSTYCYLGTSGWVAQVARRASGAAGSGRAFCVRHPCDQDTNIHAVPMTTAGGNISWLCGQLFPEAPIHEALNAFNAEAAAAPPGCDGLIFLPYLRGERCPVNDPNARACFIGLGPETCRGHMCRAVLEAICFAATFSSQGGDAAAPVAAARSRTTSNATNRLPRIGVTTSANEMEYEMATQPVVCLPLSYARSVRAAGGQPLLLPESDHVEDAAQLIDQLDGLILSGGRDADPAWYKEVPHEKTGDVRTAQDNWERALLAAATAANLPVLGICRGFQLLCVHHGGRLHQHLPDAGHDERWDGARWCERVVEVDAGSTLAHILGAGQHRVQVGNHQGVAIVPGALAPVAFSTSSTGKRLAMAAEDRGCDFCVGVQWHPEVIGQAPLFEAFVARATARSRSVTG